ncbi:MAG: hypothetical protein EBU96_08090, partial [Actinobacteria bacterium]|nr:hypothetical protein [Actinomycetota bacterium]
MDNLLVTPSSYRSLAARVIAAAISTLLIVSGLAIPAKADVTPSLASADVYSTQSGYAVDVIIGTQKNVSITSDVVGTPLEEGQAIDLAVADTTVVSNSGNGQVQAIGGSATFTFAGLKTGSTTATFSSLNSGLADLTVTVNVYDPALKSSAFTRVNNTNALSLTTGAAARVVTINSDLALTSDQPMTVESSSSDVVIEESATPVSGVATFNIRGTSAGSSVLTFSSVGHPDLVVAVTVTDPALKSDLAADVTKLDVRIGSERTVT